MKTTITTIALFALLGVSTGLQAADRYEGVHLIRGTVLSIGRVDPSASVGTGFFVDANYTSVALNAGIATKKFGESPFRSGGPTEEDERVSDKRVNNVYAGVGFGRIIQFQGGYGNQGELLRLRSDFNFRSIVDFLSQQSTPAQRMTLADRITFTVSVERYSGKDDVFNNATWGVGLLF
ncbi:hypothetical protein [Isoalcanivorax indicus]|uniref:hypothetical protein n=1 Tax=Isoalcanivorax indicus TaxID=2202653 RepID=UPI000DBA45FB|nr:hypothetical protein [Isoalcanivorax indicus]